MHHIVLVACFSLMSKLPVLWLIQRIHLLIQRGEKQVLQNRLVVGTGVGIIKVNELGKV